MLFRNYSKDEEEDGEQVKLEMRQVDRGGATTEVYVGGRDETIAQIRLVEENDVVGLEKRGLDRSVWQARVAGGVDLAVVSYSDFCVLGRG